MTDLPRIRLSKFLHHNHDYIALDFVYNDQLKDIAKTILKAQWSHQFKVWYVNDSSQNLATIYNCFRFEAKIDDSEYRNNKYFNNRKKHPKIVRYLTDDQKGLLNAFYKYLRGKCYSKSTIDTYTFYMADFMSFYGNKLVSEWNNRHVEVFIETIFIKRNYSISTHRQFISALKAFLTFEPSSQIEDLELIRPNRSKKLPNVLSQREVITLIATTKNLKHRTIIALLYSAGLRISELINLKLIDINIARRQIFIRDGKGRKDRYTSLAESILPLLQNYLISYKPQLYVFEGRPGTSFSSSSVRKFLHYNVKKASIGIRVTPHTLRHSYATHLIENGVGLRHIQELLGHSKPETTMIYTHVARKDLMAIRSPLDFALSQLKEIDKDEQKFLLSGT